MSVTRLVIVDMMCHFANKKCDRDALGHTKEENGDVRRFVKQVLKQIHSESVRQQMVIMDRENSHFRMKEQL